MGARVNTTTGRENPLAKRVAVGVSIAVVLGMVTTLALTGTREPADALKMLTGRAWLADGKTGGVTQVDGYSGKATGQAGVAQPGDPFQVVQRADGAYILDLRTGKLTRVSNATLATAATHQLSGTPSGLQLLTGPSDTWSLDRSSGILQQLDPASLAPLGPPVALGAATGTASLDADGTPWVPIPSTGKVAEVTPSGVTLHPIGAIGDSVQVAPTSTGMWAVDGQAGQAVSLTTGGAPLTIPQAAAGDAPVIASATTSPYLPILEGDQLLDIDTSRAAQSSTSSPGYAGATQMSVVGNEAYLLAADAKQLDAVNLDPLAQRPPVSVPAGSDQLVSKDGLLFVNNNNSPDAVVVSANGQVTPVSKYVPTQTPTPSTPDPSSMSNPAPAQTPIQTPVGQIPTPSGAPVGPSGSGGGTGGTGGTVPVTTTTTTPTTPTTQTTQPKPTTTTSPTTVSPQAPGQPTVSSVNASGATFTATWTPPADPGTSAITSYRLVVTPQTSGVATPSPTTVNAPTTTGTVSGLKGSVEYCAQVQAVNAAGTGALSAQNPADCATTTKDVSGAPGTPTVTLGGVSGSKQAASVTFTAPTDNGPFGTKIDHYVVTATTSGSTVTASPNPTSSPATLSLALGTSYTVTVQAVNATGNASPPATAKAITTDKVPDKVGKPTVLADGPGQLSVSWNAVPAPGNGQTVTYSVSIGSGSPKKTTGTSATFTGLTGGGKSYSVTVTASDTAGSAAASDAASAIPWTRDQTTYDCYSTLWHYHEYSNDSSCGETPGYSEVTNEGATAYPLVSKTDPQPPGAKYLYSIVIGNSTPQNSTYYAFTSNPTPPAGWSRGASTGYGNLGWVFSKSSGTGSVEMCEAYNSNPSDSSHPYYNVTPKSSAPGACIITFWT